MVDACWRNMCKARRADHCFQALLTPWRPGHHRHARATRLEPWNEPADFFARQADSDAAEIIQEHSGASAEADVLAILVQQRVGAVDVNACTADPLPRLPARTGAQAVRARHLSMHAKSRHGQALVTPSLRARARP